MFEQTLFVVYLEGRAAGKVKAGDVAPKIK